MMRDYHRVASVFTRWPFWLDRSQAVRGAAVWLDAVLAEQVA
jgi:hypothetical protein